MYEGLTTQSLSQNGKGVLHMPCGCQWVLVETIDVFSELVGNLGSRKSISLHFFFSIPISPQILHVNPNMRRQPSALFKTHLL